MTVDLIHPSMRRALGASALLIAVTLAPGASAAADKAVAACEGLSQAAAACTGVDHPYPCEEYAGTYELQPELTAYMRCMTGVLKSECDSGDVQSFAACEPLLYASEPPSPACVEYAKRLDACGKRTDATFAIDPQELCQTLDAEATAHQIQCMSDELTSAACASGIPDTSACFDDATPEVPDPTGGEGELTTGTELACAAWVAADDACFGEASQLGGAMDLCDTDDDDDAVTAEYACMADVLAETCDWGAVSEVCFGTTWEPSGDGQLTTGTELACADSVAAEMACVGAEVSEEEILLACDYDFDDATETEYLACVADALAETCDWEAVSFQCDAIWSGPAGDGVLNNETEVACAAYAAAEAACYGADLSESELVAYCDGYVADAAETAWWQCAAAAIADGACYDADLSTCAPDFGGTGESPTLESSTELACATMASYVNECVGYQAIDPLNDCYFSGLEDDELTSYYGCISDTLEVQGCTEEALDATASCP